MLEQYYNVILVALSILAFIINLIFGIFIMRRRRILVNKLFALLMFSFCWWNLAEFVTRIIQPEMVSYALMFSRFGFIALSFIPSIAFAFVLALNNRKQSRRQAAAMVLLPLIFVLLDIGGFLIKRVQYSPAYSVFVPVPPVTVVSVPASLAFVFFGAYLTTFLAFVIYQLVKFYKNCENELVKKRARYLIYGACITSLVIVVTDILSPILGWGLPPLGSFSTIFLTSFTYYSVRGR